LRGCGYAEKRIKCRQDVSMRVVPPRSSACNGAKLESLLDQQPLIVYRVMRGIARFAHRVLHRSGAQMTELTAYIFKSKAKY
jgi:hypothetical protein